MIMELFRAFLRNWISGLFILAFIIQGSAQDNLFRYVESFVIKGQYNHAINMLSDFITNNPNATEAYLKRAEIYNRLGMYDEERSDLTMAYSTNPLIKIQLDNNFMMKVIEKPTYDYAWILDDKDKQIFDKFYMDKINYEEILINQGTLTRSDSLLLKSLSLIKAKKFSKAREVLETVPLQEDPIIFDVRGLIALHTGDLPAAVDYFSTAIDLMPSFSLAYHNRSVAYKLTGEVDLALEDLEKAIDLNAEYAVFYFTKGLLFEQVNLPEKATQYYSQALDVSRDYTEAHTNYYSVLKQLGQYESAVEQLELAIRDNPYDLEYYFMMGNLNLIYGEYDEAIDHYETFLAEFPSDEKALYNKGLALLLSGSVDQGCRLINTYADDDRATENYLISKICKAN